MFSWMFGRNGCTTRLGALIDGEVWVELEIGEVGVGEVGVVKVVVGEVWDKVEVGWF